MNNGDWPCLTTVEDYHSKNTKNDGSCRTGYCFYVSEKVTLNIQVNDPTNCTYLLPVLLSPGFNFLSWCKESVLVQGGVMGEKTDKADRPTVPKFSLMLCCKGMALTFCPKNPTDPTSPYITSAQFHPQAYQLSDHDHPPSLTVLTEAGSVPSLQLLARLAGGGVGIFFERETDLMLDATLATTTYHSLANKIQF
jgi:hypothetical protein